MSKKFCLLLSLSVVMALLPAVDYAFDAKKIWGEQGQDINLLAGSLFFHSRDFIDKEYKKKHKGDHFRKAFGLSYKGWILYYFETSHHQDSVSLGIERNWFRKEKEQSITTLGFRLGAIYGYCARNVWKSQFFERCTPESKYHVSPIGQLFFNTSYKHIGFELATAFLMSNASIIIRL